MTYDDWPQWLTLFTLILPIIAWPATRVVGLTLNGKAPKSNYDWSIDYTVKVISQSIIAWVLYMGGFWG